MSNEIKNLSMKRFAFPYLYPLMIIAALIVFVPLPAVDYLVPVIVSTLPHDQEAFTQGLVIEGNSLYESTGLYGRSSLRQLDLKTGQMVRKILLPPHLFGEGITIADGRLIQLTWKEGVALIYTKDPLQADDQLLYRGEGWGLCQDNEQKALFMSDGTSRLLQRDPSTFAIEKELKVRLKGKEVSRLNDLACAGNEIYVNVWKTDYIMRLDKQTGIVTGVIDASNLLPDGLKKQLGSEAVLNGIAYHEKKKTFFLTGKFWPFIFEVKFMPKNP